MWLGTGCDAGTEAGEEVVFGDLARKLSEAMLGPRLDGPAVSLFVTLHVRLS